MSYADLSLWHETCGDDLSPRPALTSAIDVDVAVVGAGFSGLWTAYYLLRSDPTLRVAVLEREVAGFGASGRNGGWLSALFPASTSTLAGLAGSSSDDARRMTIAMRDTIGEVAAVTSDEAIECDFHRGGTISFARSPSQLARARRRVTEARAWGESEEDLRLLTADEAASFARASNVLGATYTPHCARIHPARLARGLAHAVERRGGTIYERTAVLSIEPSLVTTAAGGPGEGREVREVRAGSVIRATEGYTPALAGLRRAVVPVYSLIVATEPLPDARWDEIGLAGFPTFTDYRNLIIYGQRTADGRIVFGGRGAPYHFGSAVRPEFDREERVFADLRDTLVDLFPALDGCAFTHAWGGPLGIARDWMASVGYDPGTGLGWAGGYVGDGVSTTNLAGRTLADLVTGRQTDLTTLPWVNHRSRQWEPEPLRWLGINAGLRGMTIADHEEALTHRQSLIARALAPLVGGH
jgi:glycine/D-amino acid oxidase-like deaminating enzyme